MSSRISIAAVVTVILLGSASPAHAWFGDGWLEMLSGPGPFHPWSLDARLVCLADPSQTPVITQKSDRFGWKITKELAPGRWVGAGGCHFLDTDQPRLELGVQYMRTWSGAQNNLDYSHRPDLNDADKSVGMWSVMITADVRVNRVLDLGVAVGPASFTSADDEVFADFSKWAFQPVRVSVRPLAVINKKNPAWEFLTLRVDATKFNGGFRDSEFGARPGTFNEPGELVWGWRVMADISSLFWWN
jgi:hypothetical protein